MRLGKLALVLGFGALLAGLAPAQPPGGRGGFGGGGGLTGMIAQNKSLQDELKVDKDQIDKMTDALAKVRDDFRDEMAKLRDFNTAPEDRADISKKLGDATIKAVESVLKPEQIKRLHQIENQRAGIAMYNKEDVQKTLKLSDSQKDKIKTIQDDMRKDMADLFPAPPGGGGGRGGAGGAGGRGGFGGPNAETQKKIQALQKEATDNIAKVLDDTQKAAVKDLTGEPFELRFEGGFGGAGGFGGPPGQPGQVLSPFIQNQLRLSDDQKKQLEGLQKDVEEKLGKILTDDQKKQLKDMQQNAGRGGFGAGGRGGPGGNPPPDR